MDDYKLTVGIEPTDDYKKAKHDLVQAMQSIHKLTFQQQRELATEIFGAANVMTVLQMLNQYRS